MIRLGKCDYLYDSWLAGKNFTYPYTPLSERKGGIRNFVVIQIFNSFLAKGDR